MSYIVRVKGYNAYWTGDKNPGKLWSDKITDAKKFNKELDAINVMYTGRNMEVVEYDTAVITPQQMVPDNVLLEKAALEIRKKTAGQGFKVLSDEEYDEKFKQKEPVIFDELEPEDFIENTYFQEGAEVITEE
ncbi:hypothetical protein EB001_05050 [bacterium]|nr:hypothetical protein [bacterium]